MLRRARELILEGRALPRDYEVSALLADSWRRCAKVGLTPEGRLPVSMRLDGQQLAHAADRKANLIIHARPILEFLHSQTKGSGSMVVLADECGVVLQCFSDTEFFDRAQRVSLIPGTSWHESHRGTNGIGTALAEARPLAIHGGEHFLERNGFMSCAAAPIKAPDGSLLGVIDISGDERHHYSHTLGLVRAAAQTLENRLFTSSFGRCMRIHFHRQAEGIGTFAEGAIALSDEGWIIGANSSGLDLLGLSANDLGLTPLSRVLTVNFEDLLILGKGQTSEPWLVTRTNGERLFIRIEPGRARTCTALPAEKAPPSDTLAALACGDDALEATIGKARKLIGKPVALLLQGEPGSGKAFLASALHKSGPRSAGPFVRVNCTAIQENLLEAELFGHVPLLGDGEWPGRLREAHGGTLFIEDIQDLPLPLQTKLLDVLQKKQLTPLGGKPQAIDFVLICATRYNLKDEVAAGRFRADLYYHICGVTLRCPALRERKNFSQVLAQMLHDLSPGHTLSLMPGLATAFANYAWPGNLDQLQATLRAACAMLDPDENRIGWQHVPDQIKEELHDPDQQVVASNEAAHNLKILSELTMARAIEESHGNMSEAARRLGISRNTLYRHLRKHHLGL
jgi:transcriptional regulator of acetoin/glycerol metabolism